ncbi:vacuolar membrane protein-domain-containing protein [Parasitella parasitica]|nr:vacuolar membrane protein-domain-containing protein [Parasitella parasitica]
MNLFLLLVIIMMLFVHQSHQLDLLKQDEKSCQLLDGFGILIQFLLAFTALLTLIYKRSKETPQRPLQIWALDVSKQFFGAGMIHFINIAISYYASKPTSGPTTNLCVWYFLNVGIDTTFGIVLLWVWFTLLMNAFEKFNFNVGETGEYGPPPLSRMIWPWMRQMSVFLLAQIVTKACLYEIVINSPWLFWLGELCISWARQDPKIQVVFVMLIFPLIMNAMQFWLTDTILKVQQDFKDTNDDKHPYISTPMIAVLIEQTERTPLLFPPSKHRMAS